jgi:hypothetical protein
MSSWLANFLFPECLHNWSQGEHISSLINYVAVQHDLIPGKFGNLKIVMEDAEIWI